MKYAEVKQMYGFGEIRPPRRGELYLARPNHDPLGTGYEVMRADRNWKLVCVQILIQK